MTILYPNLARVRNSFRDGRSADDVAYSNILLKELLMARRAKGIMGFIYATIFEFSCSSVLDAESRVGFGFQSLHQMNVWHLHCVFLSFCPVGPSGREHIQNDLPQFMPLFFVERVMHGSSCPSHLGAIGLVKSLDHESLLATGS